MRIAVDSSVLLDVFTGDPKFGAASREALRRADKAGALKDGEGFKALAVNNGRF